VCDGVCVRVWCAVGERGKTEERPNSVFGQQLGLRFHSSPAAARPRPPAHTTHGAAAAPFPHSAGRQRGRL